MSSLVSNLRARILAEGGLDAILGRYGVTVEALAAQLARELSDPMVPMKIKQAAREDAQRLLDLYPEQASRVSIGEGFDAALEAFWSAKRDCINTPSVAPPDQEKGDQEGV